MKKNIIIILSFILVLGAGVIIGINLPKQSMNSKEENNQNDNSSVLNVSIQNQKVKEIYNSVKNEAWYPNYLETSYEETTDDILLSIIARSLNKDTVITDSMYETIKNKNGENYALGYQGTSYVNETSDLIISKTNEIFNKNITKEKLINDNVEYGTCTSYVYNQYLDKFIQCGNCGGGIQEFTEVVYKYEEIGNEINVYTAVATTTFDDNEQTWVYTDKLNNIYDITDFEITKENYNNFNHLRYTFKKYENNDNYYISNIENI